MASMLLGGTARPSIRCAIRAARTVVFPDPGPATTRTGPSPIRTTSRCSGVSRDSSSIYLLGFGIEFLPAQIEGGVAQLPPLVGLDRAGQQTAHQREVRASL